MRPLPAFVATTLAAALLATGVEARQSYKAEALNEAPPEDLAAPIREALQDTGVRIVDDQGMPFADLWLRKEVAANGKPSPEPVGSIIYGFLEPGQLVGAIRLAAEIGDYRDQPILPGVYTLRYGLQPVNGDHLGVSTYRDYLLLSLADEDAKLERVTEEDLEFLSTGASGTTHPAVFLLLPPPSADAEAPQVVRDEAEERTGVVLSLPATVKGEQAPESVPIQLILLGTGPV